MSNERQSDGTYRSGTKKKDNRLTIQVTDLGLTVRYGFNKAVAMVTSLSTGRPIEGATVRLFSPSLVKYDTKPGACRLVYRRDGSLEKKGNILYC